jgi:hypothetical protein
MKKKIEFTKELHNRLIDRFEARAKGVNLKGKRKLDAQLEFFLGACTIIDLINDNGETVISPMIVFNSLRGELLTKYKDDKG